jgi:histidinol-phosphatase (PHP family)
LPYAANGLPADYHVHTPYCGHAQGKIVEYVETAIQKGIPEIGFSDHLGRYYLTKAQKHRYWDWGMNPRHVGRYISEINDIAETYENEIRVRCGLEIDYIEGGEQLLESIVDLHPLDYLLGSIHCIPSLGWRHISHYVRRDSWPVFEQYFEAVQNAIESHIFDSIAHIDFIWRYVKWPAGRTAQVMTLIDSAAKSAARAGTAIEINANGFLWSQLYKVDEGDPFDALLSAITRHGAAVTIGSDAHKPQFVGKSFENLAGALKRAGIKNYSVFSQRKRSTVSL